jgi:hypothetical protein
MKYLHSKQEIMLKLRIDNLNVVKWFIDASFAIHMDMKSHTGGMVTMETGHYTQHQRSRASTPRA